MDCLFWAINFILVAANFCTPINYPVSGCICLSEDHITHDEDKSFALVSHDYGTYLKVLCDGSVVAEESSPKLLQGGKVWFVTCEDSVDKYMYKNNGYFELCLASNKEQKLVFNMVNKNFQMFASHQMAKQQ